MGFMDQNAGGGGPPLMRWNGQEGRYKKYDSDTEFNDECFVLNPAGSVAGYLKFGAKGEQPVRHTGPIYPKDAGPRLAWRHRHEQVADGEILRRAGGSMDRGG